MNKSEFEIVRQAAAILDNEEKLNIGKYFARGSIGRQCYYAVRNADELLSLLVGIIEKNPVELLSPFWNKELAERVNSGRLPMDVAYNYYTYERADKKFSLVLSPATESRVRNEDLLQELYPDSVKVDADIETLKELGYKFTFF